MTTNMARDQEDRHQAMVLAGIVLAAFAIRCWGAMVAPFIWDEYQWAALTDSVSVNPRRLHLPLHGDQHPPAQVYWGALGVMALGNSILGYRIASVLLGCSAVVAIYYVGRAVAGSKAGLIAAALLAFNEYHVGVSRLHTEKSYLTFAVFALVVFFRVLREPQRGGFLSLGALLGIGMLTKQSLALWLPFFGLGALGLFPSSTWRRVGPWSGLAVMIIVVAPDVIWNLAFREATTASDVGLAFQLSKLAPGTWSWGPMALYVRPLYALKLQGGISEYASMTTVPGVVLLLGTAVSLFVLRSTEARFVQVLGLGTFAFFSLCSVPDGEFWWADLTLFPFVVLTGGVLAQASGRWRLAAMALVLMLVVPGVKVAATRNNYYPLDWAEPTRETAQAFQNAMRLQIVVFDQRDHVQLCTLFGRPLPVCAFYRDSLQEWAHFVGRDAIASSASARHPVAARSFPAMLRQHSLSPHTFDPDTRWPAVPSTAIAAEQMWTQRELMRFGGI